MTHVFSTGRATPVEIEMGKESPGEASLLEVVDELERYVDMLGEAVAMNEEALTPILRPIQSKPSDPGAGGGSHDPDISGLNLRLRRLSLSVLRHNDSLRTTVQRVDL